MIAAKLGNFSKLLAMIKVQRHCYRVMTDLTDINAHSNVLRFQSKTQKPIAFDRKELGVILNLYGRYVAEGEWRDYAIDFSNEAATFAIHRRASEQPLYRIVKTPALTQKQGLYSVVAPGGLILKRGNDLEQVLRVLVKKPKLAEV